MHSYRYSWAERSNTAGMPERLAQQCLGHGSRAIHAHYAKSAIVKVPSLEEIEAATASGKVITMTGEVFLKEVA